MSEQAQSSGHEWEETSTERDCSCGWKAQSPGHFFTHDLWKAHVASVAQPQEVPAEPPPNMTETARRIVISLVGVAEKYHSGASHKNWQTWATNEIANALGSAFSLALTSAHSPEELTPDVSREIGNVLDHWEQLPNDILSDTDFESLNRALAQLYKARVSPAAQEVPAPDYARIIAEDDATLKEMREKQNPEWRTVIAGLPILRKLLNGENVTLESLRINLIPDDVLFNARPK